MKEVLVKTGMKNEYDIAKAHFDPASVILTGIQTVADLEKNVPSYVRKIISFGMNGGLRPEAPIVGQTIICSHLVGPDGIYYPDQHWNHQIFLKTKYFEAPIYSDGNFNESNTPAQRAKLYEHTHCWAMDDESYFVAAFCKKHGLQWTAVRNASDAWNDDVSITSHLLNAQGDVDIWAVIKAFTTDPEDMLKIWKHYKTSETQLGVLAVQLGKDLLAS